MTKDTEAAKRIRALRKAAGMNKEKFAEALKVARSLVSLCESGGRAPSTDMYVRLGNFASVRKLFADARWFWERAGIPPGLLLPVAIQGLKELAAPIHTGEIVRIPPMKNVFEAHAVTSDAQAYIPFPASGLPNPTRTAYVRVPDDSMQPMFRRGDIVVIDESEIGVLGLVGSYVAAYRHTKSLYLQERDVKRLTDDEVIRYRELARYPYSRLGIFAGWLRKESRSDSAAFVVEAPAEHGLAREPVALELPPVHGFQQARLVELPDVAVLGRIVAWISSDQPNKASHREAKKK
jgi:transcriptional regulator with XRE-family HTH domain